MPFMILNINVHYMYIFEWGMSVRYVLLAESVSRLYLDLANKEILSAAVL